MIREVSDHPGFKRSTGGFVGNRSETPAIKHLLTKDLLNNYIELRDEIAAIGPSSRLIAMRRLLDISVQSYRVEEEYLALKEEYPDHIEFLELATPLTAADRRNLEEAAAVKEEIGKLLSSSRRPGKRPATRQ